MSVKVLLEDQIDLLFRENPELETIGKNRFEIAVANIANLRYLDGLDFDDLIEGILGERGDEGIDLCYLFHNGQIVNSHNEADLEINKQSVIILKLFQVKKEDGYSTEGMRVLCEGIEEIFNLDVEVEQLQHIGANQDFISKTKIIRKIFRESKLKRAKFNIEAYYVTISSNNISIPEKIKFLEEKTKTNINYIPIKFEYWGAQYLLNLTTQEEQNIELEFEGQPMSISDKLSSTTGFAGFISGNKLMEALITEDGNFKDELTDGNIRFFLGEDKKVNSDIIETAMSEQKSNNFWAMNNGITIIGDSLEHSSAKNIVVTNPQIVNGCQTVHCLYSAYKKTNTLPEGLKVFTKLVKTPDEQIQADIISATNSQNRVKASSLRANEYIQRNIEKHLLKYGIYYERRENFYKRKNMAGLRVITLEKLTQIMHTIINKKSIQAFNDTAKVFEEQYDNLFVEDSDYDVYKFGCQLYLKIWSLKNSDMRNNPYDVEDKELISKSGFCLLHIITSIMMSSVIFKQGENEISEEHTKIIELKFPLRKNPFSIRKKGLFELLDNENIMQKYYDDAKIIFFKAANKYQESTGKGRLSLLKNRGFDDEYLKPQIETYLREPKE